MPFLFLYWNETAFFHENPIAYGKHTLYKSARAKTPGTYGTPTPYYYL